MEEVQKYSLKYEDEFVSVDVHAEGSVDYWTNPKELIGIANTLVEHAGTWPVLNVTVKNKQQKEEDVEYEFNPVNPALGD